MNGNNKVNPIAVTRVTRKSAPVLLGILLGVAPASHVPADPLVQALNHTQRLSAHVSEEFDALAVIDESEMGDMRGGFITVGGVEFSFGITVDAVIDGVLQLRSMINFTESGMISEQITTSLIGENPPSISTTPTTIDGIVGAASSVDSGNGGTSAGSPGTGAGTPTTVPGATVVGGNGGPSITQVTPAEVNLAGLEGASGVAINDAKGFTAVLSKVTQQAVQTAIVNRASGRQIDYRANIEITVGQFRAQQDAARTALRNSILSRLGR